MKEYEIIKRYYGDQRTERSKVLLINHIDEGLQVLEAINVSEETKRAYCLHPLFQDDTDLNENKALFTRIEPRVIALVMEYRNIANAYLSKRKISHLDEIKLSPLEEVNQMLIADKIQNFKDFMQYHFGKHERSQELFEYFKNWFEKLKIPSAIFEAIRKDSKTLHLEMLNK